jgi:hypothetical protein
MKGAGIHCRYVQSCSDPKRCAAVTCGVALLAGYTGPAGYEVALCVNLHLHPVHS